LGAPVAGKIEEFSLIGGGGFVKRGKEEERINAEDAEAQRRGDGLSDWSFAGVLPRSLRSATRRAKKRRERKGRVAPVGMTA